MKRKNNRLSIKCILVALAVLWTLLGSNPASAEKSLPPNIIEALENAARVNRQPNDVLELVVISVIAEHPNLLEPIIAKALALAPQDRYSLAQQVTLSFPGHTNRILAATNIYNPQQSRPPQQPIIYANPPVPQYRQAPPFYAPQPRQYPMQAPQVWTQPPAPAPTMPQPPTPAPQQLASTPDVEGKKEGWGIISEIRGGVAKHAFKINHRAKERGIDGNIEVLFISPKWMEMIGSPRPHLGSSFNDRPKDIEQYYGGITWEFNPFWSTFLDLSFGFSVHNGVNNTDTVNGVENPDAGRVRELGCKVLFRESAEFGYRMFGRHGLSLYWDHISNGGLCAKENEGMDNLGIRYGYKF